MDEYNLAVKSDSELGDVDISKLEQAFDPKVYKLWPTFLNIAVKKGIIYWESYVDENNYTMTRDLYTGGKCPEFLDWLMKVDFTDKRLILGHLSQWSSSTDFVDVYRDQYQRYRESVLVIALMSDNLKLFEKISPLESLLGWKFVKLLQLALSNKSKLLTDRLCAFASTHEPVHFPKGIWKMLLEYGDYSAIKHLENHLKLTFTEFVDGGDDDMNVLAHRVAFESPEKVKEHLLSSKDPVPAEILGLWASRIPHEEKHAVLFCDYAKEKNLTGEQQDAVRKNILSSRRDSDNTGKIIKELSSRETVFLFSQDSLFDISSISLQSWKAILANPYTFSYAKKTIGDDECPLCKDLMLPKEKRVLIGVLKTLFVESSLLKLKIITSLGSSRTRWAYENGLFSEIPDLARTLYESAAVGNVFMVALCLKEMNADGSVYRNSEKCLLSRHESSKFGTVKLSDFQMNLHRETIPFLLFWYNSSSSSKSKFLKYFFGKYFFDTSNHVNNRICSWNRNHDTEYFQTDEYRAVKQFE